MVYDTRPTWRKRKTAAPDEGEKSSDRREYVANAVRRHRESLNEVAIPRVKSYNRRAKCRKDLRKFMMTYGRSAFPLPFGEDHMRAIAYLEDAILRNGRFAMAMPRGSGKTTMVIWATIWALVYGHRRYIVVIACDMDAAKQIIDAVKGQLESNAILRDDFPKLCYPVRAIDGVAQRAARLRHAGQDIHMSWGARRIVCPEIDKSPSSGVRLEAYGLDGRLRGAFNQHADGRIERPDLAILDDPQKDKHAKSQPEVDKRERIIKGTVLGLAGPNKKIAAVMPCTVIQKNDLSDRILSPDKNPEWQSLRTKMVVRWPEQQDEMWAQYGEIRRECMLAGDTVAKKATEFYRKNREKMDAGSVVSWPARKYEHELSAIQHAENLLLDVGQSVFSAEYQNAPDENHTLLYVLTEPDVVSQLNGFAPRTVPPKCPIVVGFVDINLYGLHWVVAAFRMDRAGFILDYGKFPSGNAKLYNGDGTDNGTEEQVVRRGLDTLGEAIVLGRKYGLDDTPGQSKRVDMLMVDCGYLDQVVFDFANNSRLPTNVMPSRAYGSRNYRPTGRHGRVGDGWHESEFAGKGRVVVHCADLWRMRSQKAWLQPVGSPGSISLFGDRQDIHAEIGRQCTREVLIGIEPRGLYDQYIWEGSDNGWHDLGDCLTGIHVAASYMGADPLTFGKNLLKRRRKIQRKSKVTPT